MAITETTIYPATNPTETTVTATSVAQQVVIDAAIAAAQPYASAAETSAGASATSAAAASTSATASATSAAAALSSQTAAATSASAAATSASEAESARDAAFTNANVYADTTAGLAAVALNEQFQVVEGEEIIRYVEETGPVATEVARYPSAAWVDRLDISVRHASRGLPPIYQWLVASGLTFGIYDPNEPGTLFQDTACTTAATADGHTVKAIKPVGGYGPTLTQPSGSTFATRETDSEGRVYIDVVANSFFGSVSNTYTLTKETFIGFASAKDNQGSFALGSIAADAANGILLLNVANLWRWQLAVKKTAETSVFIGQRPGNLGYNVPGVLSGYIDGVTLTGMVDGGEHTPTQEDLVTAHSSEDYNGTGDQLTQPLTWPAASSIASCRFGISSAGGLSTTATAQRFYGAIFALGGPIPLEQQRQMHRFLRVLIGQEVVEKHDYDVFCIAGQSNGVGTSGTTGVTSSPVPGLGQGVEFIGQDTLRPIRDPGEGSYGQYAASGSAWPKFVEDYYAATGKSVCIVNGAYSGRGLQTPSGRADAWTSDGALVDRLAYKYRAAKARIESYGRKAKLRGVIWMGGEQDTTLAFSVTTHKAALVDLRDRLRTAFNDDTLPLLIVSADDYAADAADYALLRQAQSEAASENDGIELIVSYQDYLGAGNHDVSPHLNQTALNDVGSRAATACAALFPDKAIA